MSTTAMSAPRTGPEAPRIRSWKHSLGHDCHGQQAWVGSAGETRLTDRRPKIAVNVAGLGRGGRDPAFGRFLAERVAAKRHAVAS
jgi:hypothetical protein